MTKEERAKPGLMNPSRKRRIAAIAMDSRLSESEKDAAVQQIFSVWNPANTASDNAVFDGTYYDTNVWDKGEFAYAQSLEAFMASQVAHPGLVAALRAAVRAFDAEEAYISWYVSIASGIESVTFL